MRLYSDTNELLKYLHGASSTEQFQNRAKKKGKKKGGGKDCRSFINSHEELLIRCKKYQTVESQGLEVLHKQKENKRKQSICLPKPINLMAKKPHMLAGDT